MEAEAAVATLLRALLGLCAWGKHGEASGAEADSDDGSGSPTSGEEEGGSPLQPPSYPPSEMYDLCVYAVVLAKHVAKCWRRNHPEQLQDAVGMLMCQEKGAAPRPRTPSALLLPLRGQAQELPCPRRCCRHCAPDGDGGAVFV
jgi:hypothetical protein